MKKSAILLALVAMVLAAPVALAGDFHRGVSLVCSDCHVMHYSQSHGYNADGGGIYNPVGTAGPYPRLLRNDVNDLCLGCHDGASFAPDVLEGHGNGYVRSAGALNRSGAAPYSHATGHTLDSMDPAPGGSGVPPTEGLACTNCHGAHSSTSYNSFRNLRRVGSSPNQTVVDYSWTTNDLATDVYEVNGAGSGLAAHYGVDNVWYNEPDQTKSDYATFCKSCHTNFHGSSLDANMNDGSDWVRHPNADADFGTGSMLTQYNTQTNKAKVLSNHVDKSVGYSDDTPSCFSCHKSHGNANAFGLVYLTGAGTVTEQGDDVNANQRAVCKQCHTQGGNP